MKFPKLKSVLVVALILAIGRPAIAANQVPQQSSSLFDQIGNFFSSIQQYVLQVSQEFSQSFGELSGEVQSAINSSVGSLGIPDPIEAGKKIENVLSKREAKTLDTPAAVQGVDARYNWDEQYVKAQSQSVLGGSGQDQMKADANNVATATQESAYEANQADGDITTQDLVRRQVRQSALQMQALQSIQGGLQINARLAATNVLSLKNIAERENGKQRQLEIEQEADLRAAMQVAGFQNGLLAEQSQGVASEMQ